MRNGDAAAKAVGDLADLESYDLLKQLAADTDVVIDGRVRRYAWPEGRAPGRLEELRAWIAGDAAYREVPRSRMAPRVPIEVHLL